MLRIEITKKELKAFKQSSKLITTLADITPFAAKKFIMQLDLKMQEKNKTESELRKLLT